MIYGKTAIITGASRGIGRAITLELASKGANVAVLYVSSEEKAEEVCRICRDKYRVAARSYRCDVADEKQARDTVRAVMAGFGSIGILVNNAGITKDNPMVVMPEEDFAHVLDTNLKGAFLMTKYTLPVFMKQRQGVVINISSVSGLKGNAGQCSYAASKAGLIGMTKTIAREYASRGIRCNAVAPGYIETDMTEGLVKEKILQQIPLGRNGKPEEVAQAVSFLARAEYITGEVLRVDGGFAM